MKPFGSSLLRQLRGRFFPGFPSPSQDSGVGRADCGLPGRMVLQWHLTERCPLGCAHCYQEGVPEVDVAVREEILAQFLELVGHLSRRRGAPVRPRLHLTGGEPFLVPGFLEWLESLRERFPQLELGVMSTGLPVTEAMARRLAALRLAFFQVSLDGGEGCHDALRGAGNHARVLAAIRRMARAGLRPVVSFTAGRSNWRDFPEVVRAARHAGARSIWSDRAIPCGAAASRADEVLTPSEVEDWIALMAACREREARRVFGPRIRVSMGRALQFRGGGHGVYSCHAGSDLLAVLPDGTLLPCRRLPVPVGRLPEGRLTDLWENAPLLRALRDAAVPDGCLDCAVAQSCRGGLRCLSQALAGDPFGSDPGCALASPPVVPRLARMPGAGLD